MSNPDSRVKVMFAGRHRLAERLVANRGNARMRNWMIGPFRAYGWAQLGMLLVGVTFLLVAAYCSVSIVAYPYQHEFREAGPLLVVKALLEGKRPYSFEVEPAYTYVYGILYPLAVYPISKLLGVSLIQARVVSCCCVLATVVLVWAFARRRGTGWGTAVLAAALFPFTDPTKSIAQPADLGIFLCVASILVPYWGRFSRLSLLGSVLLSIAGFFTKPYFLIGIVYTSAQLFLFRSKRAAVHYCVAAFVLWVSLLYVANRLMPTYLNDCVFELYNDTAAYSFQHAVEQVRAYSQRNGWLLVAVTVVVLVSLRRMPWRHWGLDLLEPSRPLITGVSVNLFFEVSAVVILLVFVFRMGGHMGASGGTYLNHLLSPLLVLLVAEKLQALRSLSVIKLAVVFCLVLFLVQRGRVHYDMVGALRGYRVQIAALERALAAKEHVLNGANTASMMIAQNKRVYDSGFSAYFISGESACSQCLLYGSSIGDAYRAYVSDIWSKIENRSFDAVLLATFDYWKAPPFLFNHYVKRATYPYPAILGDFPVDFWERKSLP